MCSLSVMDLHQVKTESMKIYVFIIGTNNVATPSKLFAKIIMDDVCSIKPTIALLKEYFIINSIFFIIHFSCITK